MGDIDTVLLIENILAKIGFQTQNVNDNLLDREHFFIERNQSRLDVIATKIINNKMFRLGFEVKSTFSRKSIHHGLDTLLRANERERFDKLVVVVPIVTNGKSTSRLINHSPFDFEVINRFELASWAKRLNKTLGPEEQEQENRIYIIFSAAYKRVIQEIAKNPQQLQNLDWFNIEKVIAELFEGFGFEVTLTPPSKDGGKDVILECLQNETKKIFIVEIKHWKSGNKVGESVIKEFLRVVIDEKRDRGLILSSSGYTKNSLEFVAEIHHRKVALGNHSKIIQLCNAYERIKEGILLPIHDYEGFLFNETI